VLVLIITLSITVTNLQLADGFSSGSTSGMKYDLGPGETQVQKWEIYNSNQTTHLEFSAANPGSEFFTFEKNVVLEPNEYRAFDFIVSIPSDHPDNIKYIVELTAKEVKPPTEGGSAAVIIAYQMIARPSISIGDNPIYTQPVAPVVVEEEPTVQAEISDEDFGVVEEKPLETVQEKLDRIQAANQAKAPTVDDTFEESFEEEAVTDYEPEPEYTMEPEPVATINAVDSMNGEKKECGFIDWLLSLFGMGQC